ncbi:hypothetical protein ACNRBS_10565 [Ralstonia pseudosolanacearum]|nr:hypothetical protein [Ralstonia pseudosolanacearum]
MLNLEVSMLAESFKVRISEELREAVASAAGATLVAAVSAIWRLIQPSCA